MHKGHRSRLKNKFLKNGADSLEDHELLEILLFYGIPQKDTNELAHKLINTFGSLPQVFDAPMNRLSEINGVGESTALLIKLVSKLFRIYMKKSVSKKKLTKDEIREVIINKFIGRIKEHIALSLFDVKSNMVFCDIIAQGTFLSTGFYMRDIIDLSLKYNATKVIIAHNHPSGIALPSNEDLVTTSHLKFALQLIGVQLVDHIIIADDDYVSLADSEIWKDL